MALESDKKNLLFGIYYFLLSSTAYAIMGAFAKIVSREASNEQIVFIRTFSCLVLIFPFLFLPKKISLKTKVPTTHLVRGIAGLLNMYCFFYSLKFILLADAMLLNNTMPLFIPFVIWIWNKKPISLSLLPGLLLSFLGVILVLKPGAAIFQPAALVALASGLFMSISMAGVHELGDSEPNQRIMFYYFAIASFFSFFSLFWSWKPLAFFSVLLLIGVGFFAFLYQVFLTQGYKKASPSKISPLIYFAVILSAFFDWLIWKQTPTLSSWIGIILVCIGAILTLRAKEK